MNKTASIWFEHFINKVPQSLSLRIVGWVFSSASLKKIIKFILQGVSAISPYDWNEFPQVNFNPHKSLLFLISKFPLVQPKSQLGVKWTFGEEEWTRGDLAKIVGFWRGRNWLFYGGKWILGNLFHKLRRISCYSFASHLVNVSSYD